MNSNYQQSKWSELLLDAVRTPGKILAAYSAFHNYSLGNGLLALSQCCSRNLKPGPLNTYQGWQELGRQVRKGERAITLCMPITAKRKVRVPGPEEEKYVQRVIQMFVFRPYWFVLSQTDGDTPYTLQIPGFDLATALQTLNINQVEFDELDGNVQGFAAERRIALNPVAELPHKTTFHEIAHVVLGHTEEQQMVDSDSTPRSLREVEAEAVALICCEALGLGGADYCRGYIQHWLQGKDSIPEKPAQKIFSAATSILKAGQMQTHN